MGSVMEFLVGEFIKKGVNIAFMKTFDSLNRRRGNQYWIYRKNNAK